MRRGEPHVHVNGCSGAGFPRAIPSKRRRANLVAQTSCATLHLEVRLDVVLVPLSLSSLSLLFLCPSAPSLTQSIHGKVCVRVHECAMAAPCAWSVVCAAPGLRRSLRRRSKRPREGQGARRAWYGRQMALAALVRRGALASSPRWAPFAIAASPVRPEPHCNNARGNDHRARVGAPRGPTARFRHRKTRQVCSRPHPTPATLDAWCSSSRPCSIQMSLAAP